MRVKYTPDRMREIVMTSVSISEVLVKLGLRLAGGNHGRLEPAECKYQQ